MSVVSVAEVWESRSGSIDYKFQRQYVRRFRVFVDDTTDGAVTVRAGVGIGLGAAYPEDAYSKVKGISVTNDGQDPLVWYVTLNYDSVWEFDPASANENPLLRPELKSLSYETQEKFVRQDLDGEDIVNSAGTPISPPMSVEKSVQILRIKQNRATVPVTADVLNCINSSTWRGHAAKTCKIRAPEVEEVWENNVLYYAVTWVVAIRKEPWSPTKVLNEGFYEYDYDTEDVVMIRDKYGAPAQSPRLLDEFGVVLTSGDPVYLEFRFHDEINFNTVIG